MCEQAMNNPNCTKWVLAMQKEIAELKGEDTWVEVPKSKAVTNVLPSLWLFKREHSPDGDIQKFKARFCIQGQHQQGEFDTCTLVIAWSAVQLFLVLMLTLDWCTCAINFENAFCQAKLEKQNIWVHLLCGFWSQLGCSSCLHSKHTQCSISSAPRAFCTQLCTALLAENFHQSPQDLCPFCKCGVILVVCIDDVSIGAKNDADVDILIEQLHGHGFTLECEGSFTLHLGLQFVTNTTTCSITLSQPGLIQKIIEAAGVENCKPNHTPAKLTALGSDSDGEAMDEPWDFRSSIGMLLCLMMNMHPDILHAVSHAARFSNTPKKSHATAIETLICHLKKTVDKGMVLHPDGTFSLDTWVDTDFCGLFCVKPDHNPNSTHSHMGFLICLGGCPPIWKLQLMTQIALSMQESKCGMLSCMLVQLLVVKCMLPDLHATLDLQEAISTVIHCCMFQDNNGTLLLAANQ